MAKFSEISHLIVDGDWIESKDQSETGFRLIQTGNIGIGKYLDKPERAKYISEQTFTKLKCTEVLEGDILISRLPDPIGRACVVPKLPTRNITAVDCSIVRLDETMCDKMFFIYYTCSDVYQSILSSFFTGTTRTRISRKNLEKTYIPLPPLETQKQIAATLDKVTALIDMHKRQLELLEELVKGRFVEMFGTMPSNEKGWTVGKIRDVVSDVRYGSSRKAAEGDSGKYPYLRMNNITYGGELDLSDTKTIDVPENELPKCSVKRGDVLFNRTNSRELVGKTCVYNRDELMVLAGFVVRVRVNERVIPEFLSAFLNTDFSKRMLFSMCKEAIGQANINAQELQNIAIYIPPVELQNQFASFVTQTDKSKSSIQQSLAKLETLKKSLMQEYFG